MNGLSKEIFADAILLYLLHGVSIVKSGKIHELQQRLAVGEHDVAGDLALE